MSKGKLTDDSVQQHTIMYKGVYKKIFKISEYHADRRRRVAKPGWSATLSSMIYAELKLPCCLTWKVCNIRTYDVRCTGSCRAKNCDMKIECIGTKNKLDITIQQYDPSCAHDLKLKRRILPTEKAKLEKLLKGRSVHEVRSELADARMNPYDKEPRDLASDNALRIIKHRADAPIQNAIYSLIDLKKEHPNSIGAIGLDPFFIHYSTELQKACYKAECAHKKTTISIDATGIGNENKIIENYIDLIILFQD